jgi:hypothetical protein
MVDEVDYLYQAAKLYTRYQEYIKRNPHKSHVSFILWCYESINAIQEARKNSEN